MNGRMRSENCEKVIIQSVGLSVCYLYCNLSFIESNQFFLFVGKYKPKISWVESRFDQVNTVVRHSFTQARHWCLSVHVCMYVHTWISFSGNIPRTGKVGCCFFRWWRTIARYYLVVSYIVAIFDCEWLGDFRDRPAGVVGGVSQVESAPHFLFIYFFWKKVKKSNVLGFHQKAERKVNMWVETSMNSQFQPSGARRG